MFLLNWQNRIHTPSVTPEGISMRPSPIHSSSAHPPHTLINRSTGRLCMQFFWLNYQPNWRVSRHSVSRLHLRQLNCPRVLAVLVGANTALLLDLLVVVVRVCTNEYTHGRSTRMDACTHSQHHHVSKRTRTATKQQFARGGDSQPAKRKRRWCWYVVYQCHTSSRQHLSLIHI